MFEHVGDARIMCVVYLRLLCIFTFSVLLCVLCIYVFLAMPVLPALRLGWCGLRGAYSNNVFSVRVLGVVCLRFPGQAMPVCPFS